MRYTFSATSERSREAVVAALLPPTTATILSLKKLASQVAQYDIPLPTGIHLLQELIIVFLLVPCR